MFTTNQARGTICRLPYKHENRTFDIGLHRHSGIVTRVDGNFYEGIVKPGEVVVTRNFVPLERDEVDSDPHAQIISQCLERDRDLFPTEPADYSFIRNGGACEE